MEEYQNKRNRSSKNSIEKEKKISKLGKFLRLIQLQLAVCALVFLCIIGFKISVGNNFNAIKTGAFDAGYKLTNLYDLNTKLDNLARENKFVAFILGRKYIETQEVPEQEQEAEKVSEDENTKIVQTTNEVLKSFSANTTAETIDAIMPSIFIIEPEIYEINTANVLKIPALELKKQKIPEKVYYPVKNTVTSPFGERTDPINGKKSFHTGVDLRSPEGSSVHSIMSGVIEKIGISSVWGNFIVVKHKDGFVSFYAHLTKVLTEEGDRVKPNEVIAFSGNTGRSTGPHLHFEIRINDKYTNPEFYFDF